MQIEIETGAERIRAERIVPDAGTHPGVIVVHDGMGFGEHAIGVAAELAQAGYAALAVDLYTRKAPEPDLPNDRLLAFLRSVPDRQILSDLQAAIDFFSADPAVQGQKIGMIGYCWGGACTFLASGRCRGLAAAVSWYGELRTEELNERHPEHPLDAVDERACPVLALFAELDAYVPIAYVDELRTRAPRNPIDLELVVYPDLHHGFAHRGREHFDAAAHDDGWARIWNFFDRELRTSPGSTT
jgi:carboxymethylenebutenolidase